MKISRWTIILSISLIAASVLIFAIKLLVIGDNPESNTLAYIFNALGFLPLNVLFVTLLLSSMLTMRARREREEKTKMVYTLFFTEIGSELLRMFVSCDSNAAEIRSKMTGIKSWKHAEFHTAMECIGHCCRKTSPAASDFNNIRVLLQGKHEFLLRLIENPVLLEQELVSRLLQDLFHLESELVSRGEITDSVASDIAHLAGDVNRIYPNLAKLWLTHMEYLSKHYPYLFSYSLRTSPFIVEDDVVIKE
ncbi:MAG TPA: hypothetical protein O0X39_05105 [Methanocorpusculum sp.]|nr:hypothetical protein [Methanocorpusculum sp.]